MSVIMVDDGVGYFPVLGSMLNNLFTFWALLYPNVEQKALTLPFDNSSISSLIRWFIAGNGILFIKHVFITYYLFEMESAFIFCTQMQSRQQI